MSLSPLSEWARERVAPLPFRWRREILASWERQGQYQGDDWRQGEAKQARANRELLSVTDSLLRVRIPLDASDKDVCDAADKLAARCLELVQTCNAPALWEAMKGMAGDAETRQALAKLWDRKPKDQRAGLAGFGIDLAGMERAAQPARLRRAMARLMESHGIEPPDAEDGPAIARMIDPLWVRRGLRRMHARQVEAAAVRLGYVSRARDPYVSNESLWRRAEQNERNTQALENTIARNELGQEYTLAELAATGPANRKIRRAELMTRIAGFERIAMDLGHAGLFLTITCPSRMHKWRTFKNGAGQVVTVKENPRYDGTRPDEAQAYLAKVWSRIRSSLKRQGVGLYGFRIAEPNHDGTPHWHLLVFHEPAQAGALRATFRRYALADSPDEPGADRHRVDFKAIDPERGSAAGYIAKYVAKNIDGYRLEKDLIGNDALETAARVEAWAATWRIRQFQQVGGPPVGVWRELRRVESIPEGAPDYLQAAHRAVNKTAVIEGRENASVAWDHYCKAQGGVFCGRGYPIRLAKAEREGLGRYGEPLAPAVIGVECATYETYTPAHMAHMGGIASRRVEWIAESKRHQWEIVSRAGQAVGGSEPVRAASPLAPWTRVNNCTHRRSEDGSSDDESQASGGETGLRELQPDDPGGDWAGGSAAGGAAGGAHREPAGWLDGEALREWEAVHGPWMH